MEFLKIIRFQTAAHCTIIKYVKYVIHAYNHFSYALSLCCYAPSH